MTGLIVYSVIFILIGVLAFSAFRSGEGMFYPIVVVAIVASFTFMSGWEVANNVK
jgi:hypothetical protein